MAEIKKERCPIASESQNQKSQTAEHESETVAADYVDFDVVKHYCGHSHARGRPAFAGFNQFNQQPNAGSRGQGEYPQ